MLSRKLGAAGVVPVMAFCNAGESEARSKVFALRPAISAEK
jgi:hypothetical protein